MVSGESIVHAIKTIGIANFGCDIGTSGCLVCYIILTVLIRTGQYATDEGLKYGVGAASVSMIFLFYAIFGAGWQGTAWLYNTEIN